MSEEQVQIKLVVPISVKESIRTTAKQKSMNMTDYILNLHQSNVEAPMHSNAERDAALREIGLHLSNAKQSLLLECVEIALSEIEEAIKNYEIII